LIILLVRLTVVLAARNVQEEIEMRRTVLLVEDEAKLADVLAEQLAQEDFDVRKAGSLRQSLRMLDDLVPDVAVVDIGLPDGSGLDVLRRLRCGADRLDSGTPVLVLTARTEEADVLRAFERGADDYLRKPFALPELIARVHALLARGRRMHADIRLGDLLLEPAARRASWAGSELPLSGREYDLLLELARDPGAVRSKADLLREVWRMPATLRTRTVDSHASRLRRKLVAAGAPSDPIVNEWGRGYRLEVARAR
jgi:DNA-binding response OmpR family regulator